MCGGHLFFCLLSLHSCLFQKLHQDFVLGHLLHPHSHDPGQAKKNFHLLISVTV